MEPKHEQALVGLFVLVVATILVATLFALSGAFGRSTMTYHTYFAFAGGLEPGVEVRYAGGPKVGRVEKVRIDKQDPRRIEVTFNAQSNVPVKTDSVVKIQSLSPLGENHVEIAAGSPQAARARDGDTLPSTPYVDFNAVTAQLNNLAPQVKQLMQSLNERATELRETITRVNDLLSDQNRANVAASLRHVRSMLEESRPKIRNTMSNVETASQKIGLVLDDFKKTVAEATRTIDHVDAMLGENRPDIHAAVADLRRTLNSTASLAAQLDRTMVVNSENIDELLDNLRHVSENLKEFTESIKTRPSTLIRSSGPPEHKPGGGKQQ